MATPNSEQLLAIEHDGGVLLKAGAGSGKTFVLKEHIIYLIKKWINEFKTNSDEDFEQFIRNRLRRVVMMTFTKKAAGELEIRIKTAVTEIAKGQENDNSKYWALVVQNLDYLNLSTIHGFCLKLIKQGVFPGVAANQEILDESRFKDYLLEFFSDWLELNENKNLAIYPLIVKDQKSVFEAILSIFSDPTLRCTWEDFDKDQVNLKAVDKTILELLEKVELDLVWKSTINIVQYSEFDTKKWYKFLTSFLDEFPNWNMDLDGVIAVHHFFERLDYKIPSKPSLKTVPPELVSYYENVKNLKDYLKKNGEAFLAYKNMFDESVRPWFGMIKNLISYMATRYSLVDGVTFGDLEYLVYRGLENKETTKLISEQFRYFIVDEFQDTSFIQYSIIEKIIENDYSRLFCVGDLKQAIYGFRGGELGVFLECEKVIPKKLTLNHNYRSDKHIIDFNNVYFDFLFEKGLNFEGIDSSKLVVEHQTIPSSKIDLGNIYQLEIDLDFRKSDEKISNLEINYVESLAILDQIEFFKKKNEQVAVLYKRLKPSLILIDLLIKNKIGFTSQIKIPYLQDPVFGLFNTFIEHGFNISELKDTFLIYQVQAYLSLLGADRPRDISLDILDNFLKTKEYFGIYNAFCNTLEELGLKNSNFKNNLLQIKTLINLSGGDNEKLLRLLGSQREMAYSLDFQFGELPENVILMTAHASKGLQFKNIVLGGMYTNENITSFKSPIGKYPLSFKWTHSIHGKKRFKTPQYLLEDIIQKNKEFSETKRLFYVANTRAESTLSYVSINLGENKRSKVQKGSWINGFRVWYEEKGPFESLSIRTIDISKLYKESYLEKAELKPPLFHIDNLGILSVSNKKSLSYLCELSITKMTALAQCPRKFYLQNTCKIDPDELSLIGLNPFDDKTSFKPQELSSASEHTKISASERGSMIHERLSLLIEEGLTFESGDLDHRDTLAIEYAVDNLRPYVDNYTLITEKPIKFELLNYMVSGIPDLILVPADSTTEIEIWDFKTGKFAESKLAPYYFQLYSYAYSQFYFKTATDERHIKLVLLFLDEEKKVDLIVSKSDVEKYLTKMVSQLYTPWVKNLNECENCVYQKICQNICQK